MEYRGSVTPPIAWFGGKSTLRKIIVPLIPEDHKTYVEVFGGAGWVLFGKAPSKIEVLNDINGELVNFYKVIKYTPTTLIDYTYDILHSRDWFEHFKTTSTLNMNEVERAARFYYMNRTSFASKGDSFGISKSSLPRLRRPDRIEIARNRLQEVILENMDWKVLLSKYDYENAFFYLDPPYDTPSSKTYVQMFDKEAYHELANSLGKIKGRFLLSLGDTKLMREIFGHFTLNELELKYSCSKGGAARAVPRTELLISNYDIDPVVIENYRNRYRGQLKEV